MNELLLACRRLRSAPGFAAAVAVILAVGIGGTTALFALIDGIVLRPLPYPDPDRLVRLTHEIRDAGPSRREAASGVDQSDATMLLYQDGAAAFAGIAAWRPDDGNVSAAADEEATIRVRGARVTANFFDVLGVAPKLGRGFRDGEDRPGRNHVVVLSHALWRDRFALDPAVIGREIFVNDVSRTIVGIMPTDFAYPSDRVRLWLPLSIDPARTRPETFDLVGLGRLAAGVTPETAQADLATVLADLPRYAPQGLPPSAVALVPRVESLRSSIVGPVSPLLFLLLASTALVLLVACANVAGLCALRAERTRPELAVRRALGCGTSRMLARAVSEAVLLSAVGGAGGLVVSLVAVALLRDRAEVFALPRLDEVAVRGSSVLFALAATALAAVSASLLPAIRARSVAVARTLRGAGPGTTPTRSHTRARDALVVAQIALAFMLLAAFGLTGRSFLHLRDVDAGFDAAGVATSRVLLPYARYGTKEARVAFFAELIGRLRTTPGVVAVGTTDWVPLDGHRRDMALDVESPRPGAGVEPGGEAATHSVAAVDGAYFRTLGIPLLRGRTFTAVDPGRPAAEAIVSRAFAERYWPGETPLGHRVRPLGGRWHTVVGEVADVHYDGLDRAANDLVYFPLVMAGEAGTTMPSALAVVARTRGATGEVLAAIRGSVRAIDPAVPTYDEASLADLVRDASERSRTIALAFALAAGLTTLLSGVGLYAVIAYAVSQRRRELAVRMALGARPGELRLGISLDGLRLGALGVFVGLLATLATAGLLGDLLFAVDATDLPTLTTTPIALLLVALLATYAPARRAGRVSPAETLKTQ